MSVMAPRGRFQRYPGSTTTPYHSKGTGIGVFAAYFTDGSYWRVLTVHIASLEVRKGRLHLSGRHRRMTVFVHLRRLSDVSNRRKPAIVDRYLGRLNWADSCSPKERAGTAGLCPEAELSQ